LNKGPPAAVVVKDTTSTKGKEKGRKGRKDPKSQVELRSLRGVTSPKGLSSSAEIGES
jgi:hypothetical protein